MPPSANRRDNLSFEEAEAVLQQLAAPSASIKGAPAPAAPSASTGLSHAIAHTPAAQRPAPSFTTEIYRGLIEKVPDALVVIDETGRIVMVNAQTEHLFAYRRDELIGQMIEVLVPERGRDQHIELRDAYLAAPQAREMSKAKDLVGRRKDGVEVPVEISLSPLPTEAGLLVVSTIRDVTDRRRAHARLLKLEARYRTLVEGIPAVTFMAAMDEGPGELYVSPQIERLLGFSQKEWVENPILWFTQLHPDDKARWHQEFARTVAAGEPFRSDYRFIARDGRVVWVHGEAQVVRDDAGRPLFLQGVAFDITSIKQAQDDLRALNAALDQRVAERTAELVRSNAALGVFARDVAHDLKSPLISIRGLIGLLARNCSNSLDEKGQAYIASVQNVGAVMMRLIEDLFAYARIRTEGKPFVPVECAAALKKARKLVEASLEEVDGQVTATELPTVLADQTQLVQLFQNLMNNAVKYRSERPLEIRVSARQEGAEWVIEVKDNGIGVEPKNLKKIFEIGVRSRQHLESEIPGSGIGLTICESIVQRHGGRIWASSEGAGTGATISFTLPGAP